MPQSWRLPRPGRRARGLALDAHESEARLLQLAENLGSVVWLSEPSFPRGILYINGAYESIWGRSVASLIADPGTFCDGIHPEDRPRTCQALCMGLNEASEVHFRVLAPDGQVRWLRGRSFPVLDRHGRPFRVAGILEDVTAHWLLDSAREGEFAQERTARASLERRFLKLEEAAGSRQRLIRGFTHDIKNPLFAADMYLALLLEGQLGGTAAKRREILKRVRHSIDLSLELIAKQLEIARAEAGELQLDLRETDVVSLVREVIDTFSAQAQAKQLRLSMAAPGDLPRPRTDPTRIRQVLGNLLSNAVKYTPAGGTVVVQASVGPTAHTPTVIAVTVSDTGPGIPEDRLSMLFREFSRLDPAAAEGVGLGLSGSRTIARALGGEIAVQSAVGKGSAFTLEIPISPAVYGATRAEGEAGRPPRRREAHWLAKDASGVLVPGRPGSGGRRGAV